MRKFSKIFMLFLALGLFIALVGCDKIELSFDNQSEELEVGEDLTLEFTVSDSELELEWSVDDNTIVSVDQNGKVTALKEGTAIVTVKVKDKKVSDTITITVTAPAVVDPVSIAISDNPATAKVGEIVQFKVNVLPAAASQEVTWSSSNTAFATVDDTGKVTFKGIGEVVITATSKAKTTIKRDVTVNVVAPDPTEIVVASSTGVDTVMLYEKLQMVATVNPEIAVDTITWSVDDNTIATISDAGLLDAKKVGKVIVTATSTVNEEVFGTKEITISLPQATNLDVSGPHTIIQVDEEMQLVSKILPDLALQAVTYSVDDDTVLTVDDNGKVKGLAEGDAIITVTSVSNESLTKTYNVKVIEKVAEPTHVNFLVDASLADQERFSEITIEEEVYVLGVNAFVDFSNFTLSDESKIFVKKGTYTGNIFIDKNNVEIYSENKDKNPNTSGFNFDNQAILNGKITVSEAQDGLTINGLSFTETGKVEAIGALKNFNFLNNHIYDTVETTAPWNAARDYLLKGIVTLWKQNKIVETVRIENNKFNNVSETNIMIGNTKGLIIKNNTFTNFDRDAIRIDGGSNYLSTKVEGNRFTNDEVGGYNGIYFRSIGVYNSTEEKNIVEVKDNHFENIGTSDALSGAFSANSYQEFGAEVNITHNTFVNCVDYIWLRNNATAANHAAHLWVGNINYNVFLGIPETYYHKNLNGADTELTNPTLVNMDYNFFGDLDGNPVDLDSDEIQEKFFSVSSLEYTYTSIEAMTAIFVNSEWDEVPENGPVTYDGMKFTYGVNAFSTITDALAAVEPRGIIIVLPGTYDEEVEITNGVQLRTLNANLNPVLNDTPFKADSETAVTITGVWYINNTSNVSIKGFSFTGAARVRQYGPENAAGTSNFLFENNYAYDTDEATIAWKQTAYAAYGISTKADTTMPGFLSLAQFATWMTNTKIINNKFENVSDTNIVLICASGAIIFGNSFTGGDRDAIRLDYASLNGVFDIKDNVIEDFKYNGIYVRSYAVGWASITFNIEGNRFANIGEASLTETPASTRIGAIATSGYSEANSATFNIRYNEFEDNYNYISLRPNVTNVETWATKPHTWKAIVEFNSFIDGGTVEYYFRNLMGASDTELTNLDNIIFDKNFYGVDAETKATITDDQFDHIRYDDSNLVVFDTLAELKQAIVDYNEFIKPIIVDQTLADKEEGDVVVYDGVELKVGTSAFATLGEAVTAAVSGKVIIVKAGTYEEAAVNVTVNDLKIYGPNMNINPMTGTRKEEVILKTVLTIGTGVKNTLINGFQFEYNQNSSYVAGHADGLIEGFEFSYNIFNGASGGGAEAAIRFKQLTAEAGNKDFTYKYNYIRNMGSDRAIRMAYIENVSFIGNRFEDNTSDVIRLNDNGGSATGKLVLQDNQFIRVGQFALFLGATTIEEIIISGNEFDSMGTFYAGSALSIRKITPHENGTTIIVEKNSFIDAQTSIRIDHDATEDSNLTITVSENDFYTPASTIYTNTLTGIIKTTFMLNNKVYDAEDVEVDLAELFASGTTRIYNAELETE